MRVVAKSINASLNLGWETIFTELAISVVRRSYKLSNKPEAIGSSHENSCDRRFYHSNQYKLVILVHQKSSD